MSEKLYAAVFQRQTVRAPLNAKHPLPKRLYGTLKAAACQYGADLVFVTRPSVRQYIAALQGRALKHQWRDHAFRSELADWIRPAAAGDGVSAAALAGLPDRLSPWLSSLVRRCDLSHSQLVRDCAAIAAAPAVAILVTPGDGTEDWLQAGLAIERVLLAAAAEGVVAQSWNAAVQVAATRDALADLVQLPDRPRVPQRLLGLGYANHPAARSPRRPVRAIARAIAPEPGPASTVTPAMP